jgi:hypothetical protein
MNMTDEKNFLMKNVDEQAEWPLAQREKIELNKRQMQEKIEMVQRKREQREEELREKYIEQSRKWEVLRQETAERKREEERIELERHRKRLWVTIVSAHAVVRDQFFGKFMELRHMKKVIRSVKKMTTKLIYFLRKNLKSRGKDADTRLKNKIRQTFNFL